MRIGRSARLFAVAVISLGGGVLAAATVAKPPTLAVIGGIEPGEWQLREDGSTGAPRSLCVEDPDMLIQLQHRGAQCSRFVIDDQPRTATVHYTCPGAGHGRTTIRLETRTTFHLDTQGIANGLPFDTGYEVRRMGACQSTGR